MCFSSESEDEEESVEGSHHGGMAKRHKGEKDRTTVSTYYEKTYLGIMIRPHTQCDMTDYSNCILSIVSPF